MGTIRSEDHTEYQTVPRIHTSREEEDQIIEQAISILKGRAYDGPVFTNPVTVKNYLTTSMSGLGSERFRVLFLSTRHHLIAAEDMFFGTIDGASIYPREVVKAALEHNASAVILAHNHPSGVVDPSRDDIAITTRLKEALKLVEVRVLDHIVVGAGSSCSMAERGLL